MSNRNDKARAVRAAQRDVAAHGGFVVMRAHDDLGFPLEPQDTLLFAFESAHTGGVRKRVRPLCDVFDSDRPVVNAVAALNTGAILVVVQRPAVDRLNAIGVVFVVDPTFDDVAALGVGFELEHVLRRPLRLRALTQCCDAVARRLGQLHAVRNVAELQARLHALANCSSADERRECARAHGFLQFFASRESIMFDIALAVLDETQADIGDTVPVADIERVANQICTQLYGGGPALRPSRANLDEDIVQALRLYYTGDGVAAAHARRRTTTTRAAAGTSLRGAVDFIHGETGKKVSVSWVHTRMAARRAGTHAAYRHRFSVLDMRPLRATKDDDEHGANEHYASAVRVWRAVRAVACD